MVKSSHLLPHATKNLNFPVNSRMEFIRIKLCINNKLFRFYLVVEKCGTICEEGDGDMCREKIGLRFHKNKKEQKMNATTKKFLQLMVLLGLGGLFLFLSSCDEAPTGPEPGGEDLQLSKAAAGAATLGWQTLHELNTQSQFAELAAGEDGGISDAPGMVNSLPDIRREAHKASRVVWFAQKAGPLRKTTGDSLIWSEEWDDPVSGTAGRRALFYDPVGGTGRIYEVIYKFPPQVQLRYDSTAVLLYLGPTLTDSTDDRLLRVDKLSRFEPGFAVERVEGSVEATDWGASNEVTGAIANNNVLYGNQTELWQMEQRGELDPDGSAQFSETLTYRDNTTLQRQVSFHPDHTGTFSESWRDGTTVTGTFDLFEDDNHAKITRTVNFADHPLLEKLQNVAEYTFHPADSSSEGLLSEVLFFKNGSVDSTRIEAQRRFVDGYWTETLAIQTANEGSTNIEIIHKESFKEFSGDHTAADGFYARFHGTEYQDGSGELWLEIYASRTAYENGADPLLTLHIFYSPDGSGRGTLTENGKTYQVKFAPNGGIEIVDDAGRSVALNGYQ